MKEKKRKRGEGRGEKERRGEETGGEGEEKRERRGWDSDQAPRHLSNTSSEPIYHHTCDRSHRNRKQRKK